MQYTANSINGSNLEPKTSNIPAAALDLKAEGRITNEAATAYLESGNCRGVLDCASTIYLEGVCPQCGADSFGIEISTGRTGCRACGEAKQGENWRPHGPAVNDAYGGGVRAPGGDSLPSSGEIRVKVPKYAKRTKDGKQRGMMAPSVPYKDKNAYEVRAQLQIWVNRIEFPAIPGRRRNARRDKSMRDILTFLVTVTGLDPAKPGSYLRSFYSATRIGQNVGLGRQMTERHLRQLAEWGMIVMDNRFYVEGKGRDIWLDRYWDLSPEELEALPGDDPFRLDKAALFPASG